MYLVQLEREFVLPMDTLDADSFCEYLRDRGITKF